MSVMGKLRVYFVLGVTLLVGCPYSALGHQAQPDLFAQIKLRNLGPAVSGGRVTAVAGIAGQPYTYYVGTAAGGLWKTTSNGASWKELLKREDSPSIGAIALNPSDSQDVWVGTGEANPRSDVINGHGIYFSSDGGKTWVFKGLSTVGQIAAIVVDPRNSRVVYVAALGNIWRASAQRGIYMTKNGGSTWKRILYVNGVTGASALVMDPKNPDILLAGMWTVQRRPWTLIDGSSKGGIWRTVNGGRTWSRLKRGLPDNVPTDRVGLAISPSNPRIVYALMANADGVLYRSDNLGASWKEVSDNAALDIRPFYFSVLAVAPNDPERVYFASSHLLESNNGGKTVHVIDQGVHPDHHAIWIDPENAKRIIQGNDGGAYVSVNGGKNWRYLNNLPIEQFYAVSVMHTRPFGVCGGIQDNASVCGPSNSLSRAGIIGSDWWSPVGGDGQYVVPAPSDPNLVYAEAQDGYIRRIHREAPLHVLSREVRPYLPNTKDRPEAKLRYRFNWTAPIAVPGPNPNVVYVGANVVFRSRDGGATWKAISPDLTRNTKAHQQIAGGPILHDISGAENYDTILSIAVAPADPKVIWVGTDDGLVWVTRDGGRHWKKLSPPLPHRARWGRVYQIGISPFNPGAAYLAVDAHMLGDPRPYVFKVTGFGKHWSALDAGLPDDHPAYVVREDPNHKGLLALGTDIGLYFSFDDGRHWQRATGNFPATPVFALQFTRKPHDLIIGSHGRGIWIFDNLQVLEGWKPDIANERFHLFRPSQGVEWVLHRGRTGFINPTAFVAPNPPDGPMLAWWLGPAGDRTQAQKRMTVTVRTLSGQHVARFRKAQRSGITRVAWNMRYEGPESCAVPLYPREPEGPFVLPGKYTVAVATGEDSRREVVHVLADPYTRLRPNVRARLLSVALQMRNALNADVAMLNYVHLLGQRVPELKPESRGLQAMLNKVIQTSEGLRREIYNPALARYSKRGRLHFIKRLSSKLLEAYGQSLAMQEQGMNLTVVRRDKQLVSRLKGILKKFNALLLPEVETYNRKVQRGANRLASRLPVVQKVSVRAIAPDLTPEPGNG